MPGWRSPVRAKQLFMCHCPRDMSVRMCEVMIRPWVGVCVSLALICSCHCPRDMAVRMREIMARPWVGVCVPLALSLHYFNAVELSYIYFSSITLFHDISKQIRQCARIGEIFARWHLAIAITGKYFRSEKRTRRGNNSIQVCSLVFIKLSWIDFTSDKFGIFPSNFYQHHNFYNLLMSSCGKTMLTYKLDQ